MTEFRVFRRESCQSRSAVLLMMIVLCGGPRAAVYANAASGRIVPLTHISPERGREFLSRLKIATASRLGTTQALLVTAEPGELRKALAVLDLVDTRTEFDIQELGAAATIVLPEPAQMASAVGGVAIGTFANPPQDRAKMRAIVDVHNGMVVAVAPIFQLRSIRHAVGSSSQEPKPPQTGPSPLPVETLAGAPRTDSLSLPVSRGPWDTPDAPWTELKTSTLNLQGLSPQKAEEFSLSPEMQRKLRQMQERLDELQMQRVARSQLGASAGPAAAPTVPTTEPQAAEKPAGPPPAEPQPPAQPQPTPESRPEEIAPARVNESAAPAAEPSSPTPVAQPPAEPGPRNAAAAAAPPTPPAATPAALTESPEDEAETSELTLPERLPVIMLLDLVGKYLNLSYVYNPDEVKGEVSLKLNGRLTGAIKVKDLYPLLEQTLKANNLVTTRHKGNIVTIVHATRAADADPKLIDDFQLGDTVVIRQFDLKYIDTTAAKSLLDNMRLGLDVTALPEKRMLIVMTYACRLDRIEKLLQLVDQPGEPKIFRFRQLRYTMAKTLAEKVKAMAEQMLDSVSVTVAEADPAANIARTPGESDIAYRTRVAQIRVQQQALRQTQAIQRAQLGQETKPGVYLDADERTNRVLMIGAEKQLAIVEELVNSLDVEQHDPRALQLYRMKHVDAEDVARKLQELGVISRLPDSATSSYYGTGTARITPQLPGQPRPPPPATPEMQVAPTTTEVTERGLVEEPQVVVVEATNALLVNATAEQHAKIANIIAYVDSETLVTEIPYKIYPLENSSPQHLAEVLQSLIQETVEQQREGGKIERTVVSREEKIKIVPDPNTYSLIVYANKKNQEWISNLVAQLDKRRPQVLIDVTLVEISKTDKFDYDLNLIRSSPDLAATSGVSGIKPGADALGKFVQTGGGALSAFYGDRQIQALLETMQTKTYGRVLAKPKLLVNDNENGKIETKDTKYVEVTNLVPLASATSGPQQGGIVQTSTSFNSYEAGITLDITPHISEGNLLRLDIILTRSDFDQKDLASSANRPPGTGTSQVDTKVTLPNGSTVILGGMLRMNQSKGGSKVPLLGDIPLVGGLFRSVRNADDQRKLYMFVKAEIIRPDETVAHGMKELEVLSERDRLAFEKNELEFHRYEDWPGIKPKRVDPPKVLDAR
ncbi:MAG: hypothetical protein FJ280_18365 [Planctomycetes bacterium]|nr:hypothetical protein [Planctomycetota bacterium]